MGYKIIYHGSEKAVEKPIYHYQGSNLDTDYGIGFYCTKNLDMAKEWANRTTLNGFANKYQFDDRGLKILDLCDKSKYSILNWVAILMHNRKISKLNREMYADELAFLETYYIDVNEYDVVIGFRADDRYFAFPMMFIQGILRYETLEDVYLNGNLGQQYVLISERAFSRIFFVEAIPAEPIFHERYESRVDAADKSYIEMEIKERKAEGKRIGDLIKENAKASR